MDKKGHIKIIEESGIKPSKRMLDILVRVHKRLDGKCSLGASACPAQIGGHRDLCGKLCAKLFPDGDDPLTQPCPCLVAKDVAITRLEAFLAYHGRL